MAREWEWAVGWAAVQLAPQPAIEATALQSLTFGLVAQTLPKSNRCSNSCFLNYIFMSGSKTVPHTKSHSTMGKWSSTHPSTLSSNKLVIFSLDTSPAASIIVLLFKVRVIFQLLRCLWEKQSQSWANSQRARTELKTEKAKVIWVLLWQLKRAIFLASMLHYERILSNRLYTFPCVAIFSIEGLTGSQRETAHN